MASNHRCQIVYFNRLYIWQRMLPGRRENELVIRPGVPVDTPSMR
jgi:hypothetical protein